MQTLDNGGGIDQVALAQRTGDLGAERFQRHLGRLVRCNVGDALGGNRFHRYGRHDDTAALAGNENAILISEVVNGSRGEGEGGG